MNPVEITLTISSKKKIIVEECSMILISLLFLHSGSSSGSGVSNAKVTLVIQIRSKINQSKVFDSAILVAHILHLSFFLNRCNDFFSFFTVD